MSLPVFVCPELAEARIGELTWLSGAEGRHAVTVRRIGAGQRLKLIDGEGCVAEAVVTAVEGKDRLAARVESLREAARPRPWVVVVQAIPKSERAELAVDLATQAGADEIVAWQADRCVARWDAKKAPKALAKWQAAATAAAKQSRRDRIPAVRGPVTTGQLAARIAGEHAYVLHEDATASIKDVPLEEKLILIIGPEGGIGAEELERLGALPIRLGPQVLRTASAAMVALAAIGVRSARW